MIRVPLPGHIRLGPAPPPRRRFIWALAAAGTLLLLSCGAIPPPPTACEPLTYCGRDSDCASAGCGACVGGLCLSHVQELEFLNDALLAPAEVAHASPDALQRLWTHVDRDERMPLPGPGDGGEEVIGRVHPPTLAHPCAGWGCKMDSDCPPTLCFYAGKTGRCEAGECRWR
jgi:hypothetical protein